MVEIALAVLFLVGAVAAMVLVALAFQRSSDLGWREDDPTRDIHGTARRARLAQLQRRFWRARHFWV